MSHIMNIFYAPTKVFASLKEKPTWIMPFVIVLIVVAISAALTVGMNKETIIAKQEERMRERGMSEEEVEQALRISSGSILLISSTIGGAVFTAVLLLIFSVILNLFIPLLGGTSAFKTVFAVVCFSSLVTIPAAILKVMLIMITKSLYVTTSLALLVPNLAKDAFMYKLLAGFDFFIIWEMILVSMGISITNGIKKQNAYILVFIIWIASIFIGIALGGLSPR